MPQDNDDKKKLQESTTNSNTMKRNMSNPGLYNQLDQSQWMWTPPGATHKRFGKKRMMKKKATCSIGFWCSDPPPRLSLKEILSCVANTNPPNVVPLLCFALLCFLPRKYSCT